MLSVLCYIATAALFVLDSYNIYMFVALLRRDFVLVETANVLTVTMLHL